MSRFRFIIFFLLCLISLPAQSSLLTKFDRLSDYNTRNEEKITLSEEITVILADLFQKDTSSIVTSGIRQLKKATSPDGKLTFYTWHYFFSDQSSHYGGVFMRDGYLYPLKYKETNLSDKKSYKTNEWYGGVCYKIIQTSTTNDPLYTLLFWDGHDGVTYRKIIDVLSWDARNRPVFGLPVFESVGRISHRVVLEYNAKSSLFLEYDEGLGALVTSDLTVIDGRFDNVQAYYVPDVDFNAYYFEGKRWILRYDVDVLQGVKDAKAQNRNGKVSKSGI